MKTDVFDFHIWLSPGLSDAIEASTSGLLTLHRRPNSSSAPIVLWLFLHLHLLAFFSTSLQDSPNSCWARFAIAAVQAVELKWLIWVKVNKWFHSSRVKFPRSVCLRVDFWCQCIRFTFWSPNWFYRTTNQEQLCGFWKRVPMSGFFPL